MKKIICVILISLAFGIDYQSTLAQDSNEISELTLIRNKRDLNEQISTEIEKIKSYEFIEELIHDKTSEIELKKLPDNFEEQKNELLKQLSEIKKRSASITTLADVGLVNLTISLGYLEDLYDFELYELTNPHDDQLTREESRALSKIVQDDPPYFTSPLERSWASSTNGVDVRINGTQVFQIKNNSLSINEPLIETYLNALTQQTYDAYKKQFISYLKSLKDRSSNLISGMNKVLKKLEQDHDKISLDLEGKKE